jgi:LPS-assembly protein
VSALAADKAVPMHWSAEKQFWDRRSGRIELIGNAAVHQPGESLRADRIWLDLNKRTLDATGNCVYIASDTVIYGDEIHFNLDDRTGTIVGGRVANDRFSLTGRVITRLSESRFLTEDGSYTTCRDCPQSWTLHGGKVDMEFEGYAYMSNVTSRIKDAPFFWLPYLVVPLKTKRQTGLLFPRFGFQNGGFTFVQPFFWAIGRSVDMTIGLGEFGGRGMRGEWEGRYRLSNRSAGTASLFYVKDKTFAPRRHRWALDVAQVQELPFGIEQKLRLLETSDNLYVNKIGDIPGRGEAVLSSDLIFSHSSNQVSTYVAARRYRSLLNVGPSDSSQVDFDSGTVQAIPSIATTTQDRFLFDSLPVATGITVSAINFFRTAGPFDRAPPLDDLDAVVDLGRPEIPGSDPIREATRLAVTPSMYATLRPWDRLSLVPAAEYRAFFYSFHNRLPNLYRGYLLVRADLSTQLERVYETSDPDIPRVKHLIRPMLTYSLIPYVREDESHPFIRQMRGAAAAENPISGFNFDNLDIVPRDTTRAYNNYFIPLGNSLTYGLSTQLIRRRGAVNQLGATYQRSVEVKAGQTFNFRELRQPVGNRQPLSRLFASLGTEWDKFTSQTDYVYVPYIPISEEQKRHVVSTTFKYTAERSIHQRIFEFERSLAVGYSFNTIGSRTSNLRLGLAFSLNDNWLPTGDISYDLISSRILDSGAIIRYQSASQCWKAEVGGRYALCPAQQAGESNYCPNVGFNLTLNLTGSGYGDFGPASTPAPKSADSLSAGSASR